MAAGVVATIRGYARLFRVRGAGQTALYFLGGAAVSAPRSPIAGLVLLWVVGVLAHCFANAVNDLADMDLDMQHPRGDRRPLVSGDITSREVLAICLVLALLIAGVLVGYPFARGPALGALGVTAVLGLGNVYQKRIGGLVPLFMDVLFGLVVAAPLLLSPLLLHRSISSPTIAIAAVVMFQMMALNAIAGNLKDLAGDRAAGAFTTAIQLGVRQEVDQGPVQLTREYVRWSYAVRGLSWVALLAAYACDHGHLGNVELAGGVVSVVLLAILDERSVRPVLSGHRPPSGEGSELYVGAEYLALAIAIGILGSWSVLGALVLAALVVWGIGSQLERIGSIRGTAIRVVGPQQASRFPTDRVVRGSSPLDR